MPGNRKKHSSGKKPSPWNSAERAILEPYKPAFRAADKEGRRSLLAEQILPRFLELHPKAEGLGREFLKKKVKDWFSNTGRKEHKLGKFLLLPRATFTKVLLHEKKAEVLEEVKKLTPLASGPAYLGFHKRATKIVSDNLGREGREEMKKIQGQWEDEGWPEEAQRRYAPHLVNFIF
jgi:hypothetical protein